MPLTLSLGRHTNDQTFSFYRATPSLFNVELGFDGIEVDGDLGAAGLRPAPRSGATSSTPRPRTVRRASCTRSRAPANRAPATSRPTPLRTPEPAHRPSRRLLATGPERTVSTVPAPFAAVEEFVGVGPAPTATQRRERLRSLLSDGRSCCRVSPTPSARAWSRPPASTRSYATGAGLANAQYGIPDLAWSPSARWSTTSSG